MDTTRQAIVTALLQRVSAGDRQALDEIFPLVYQELRVLARSRRRRQGAPESLNTTDLVHETYLRLVGQEDPHWRDHAHFRAVAATAMRHILIDNARHSLAAKRGGGGVAISLTHADRLLDSLSGSAAVNESELLVALDEALRRLETHSERQARIVECRFFAGMTVPDTAVALNLSPATVKRGWAMAQAWLHRELERSLAGGLSEGPA